MDLEAQDAVAEVEEARRVVARDLPALPAHLIEREDHRVDAHRLVLLAYGAELELLRPFGLVEALVAALQHLPDPRADLDAEPFHLLSGLGDAEEVPGAEGAGLVGEAPLHRVVDVLQRVADLGYPPRGIGHVRQQRVAEEPRVPVVLGPVHEEAEPRAEVALALRLPCYRHLRVLGGLVLERLQVQDVEDGLAVSLAPLVEAPAGLVAEEVLLDHLLELRGRLELLARLVLGDELVEVLGNADGDVEADLIV